MYFNLFTINQEGTVTRIRRLSLAAAATVAMLPCAAPAFAVEPLSADGAATVLRQRGLSSARGNRDRLRIHKPDRLPQHIVLILVQQLVLLR